MCQLLVFPKFPSVGNLNTIFNTILNTIFNTIFLLGIGPQVIGIADRELVCQ